MELFPAIDLRNGQAVRLFQGDYDQMTVYSSAPEDVAREFKAKGARNLHLVDLDGAKDGELVNFESIRKIVKDLDMFVEVGGGIRDEERIKQYLDLGVGRVILGTIAIKDPEFLEAMVAKYKEKIAVGVDIKDGLVAIKGWTEKSQYTCNEFMSKMQMLGVKTVICTDISKDGAMKGTNIELYKELSKNYNIDIIASGGVTNIDDIKKLREMELYGAIIGKAYYTNAISIKDAIEVAK